jgi:diguanylate cyclase (GGDEF)-like protein
MRTNLQLSGPEAGPVRLIEPGPGDAASRLAERPDLQELVREALDRGRRSERLVAVLYLGIDGFGEVEQTLGRRAGGSLLRRITNRLREAIASPEGGEGESQQGDSVLLYVRRNKYVLVSSDIQQPQEAARTARRMLDSLSRGFTVAGQKVFVTASIGIAVQPPDGGDPDSLLRHSVTALYLAKKQGCGTYRFYSDAMHAAVTRKIGLEGHLRNALGREELQLHYQPLVDVHSRRVIGVEALVRWESPQLGRVSPGEFIPIAEESGLIAAIDAWVIETACLQMRRWSNEGLPSLRLSVNVSSHQLCYGDFAAKLAEVIRQTGIRSRLLEIELTESGIVEQDPSTLDQLQRLKSLGVSVAIDDFGTGYSALGYLRKFPVDTIKIDRSFVAGICSNREDAAFVCAIIAMAHCLSLRVVAEGVETEAQLAFLRRNGCDEAQGFLFAEPLPAGALPRFVCGETVVAAPQGGVGALSARPGERSSA